MGAEFELELVDVGRQSTGKKREARTGKKDKREGRHGFDKLSPETSVPAGAHRMRRVARTLFTLLVPLSVLLCVLSCILWVRSYWRSDRVDWRTRGGSRYVWTAQGHLVVGFSVIDVSGEPAKNFGLTYVNDAPLRPYNFFLYAYPDPTETQINWERGGFAWYQRRKVRESLSVIAIAPFWSVAVATALLPGMWMIGRWGGARRRRRGLCLACGYDLRASPERCPECGVRADASSRIAAGHGRQQPR
jgi:hypothetical protein